MGGSGALQGRTHRLVSQHRPDVREGLPQHQLDLEGLEAYSKETQLTQNPAAWTSSPPPLERGRGNRS